MAFDFLLTSGISLGVISLDGWYGFPSNSTAKCENFKLHVSVLHLLMNHFYLLHFTSFY